MIINLPKEITIQNLQDFDFGNLEANEDDLLFDSICKTSSVAEFLGGKKNIVLGEKGTGKTALFRLLNEGKISFKQKNGYKNILIPIDNTFHYKNIKGKVLKLIKTDNEDIGFKYQVVWELFIFYKIITKLDSSDIELSATLKEAKELVDNIFNKNGIDSFLQNKKTLGLKLYDTPTSILPDLYYTSEPIVLDENIKEKSVERLEIDLDKYKKEIDSFIKKNEINIVILIDRLDEFVSKSSIQIQLELLEALIAVEREYGRYNNIEIKLFLRDDLFKQLSFDNIGGYDKVISKKVDLDWSAENIREFIAKRILSNYKNVFKTNHLGVSVDRENLEIDTSLDNQNNKKPDFWGKLYRKLVKKFNADAYSQKFPRQVSLDDDINQQLILTIFPNHVCYRTSEGNIDTISIFEFLATNFNLGTRNSIPRLILIFLEKVMTVTTNYYLKNGDQLPIKKTDLNNFEIIKEGFFDEAYSLFKEEIYINFSKLNPEFEKPILLFKEKIGNKFSFRAKELKNIVNITNDEELYHFCSYMLHIGFFERTNSVTTIENMKFELPVMFRITKERNANKGYS